MISSLTRRIFAFLHPCFDIHILLPSRDPTLIRRSFTGLHEGKESATSTVIIQSRFQAFRILVLCRFLCIFAISFSPGPFTLSGHPFLWLAVLLHSCSAPKGKRGFTSSHTSIPRRFKQRCWTSVGPFGSLVFYSPTREPAKSRPVDSFRSYNWDTLT